MIFVSVSTNDFQRIELDDSCVMFINQQFRVMTESEFNHFIWGKKNQQILFLPHLKKPFNNYVDQFLHNFYSIFTQFLPPPPLSGQAWTFYIPPPPCPRGQKGQKSPPPLNIQLSSM